MIAEVGIDKIAKRLPKHLKTCLSIKINSGFLKTAYPPEKILLERVPK